MKEAFLTKIMSTINKNTLTLPAVVLVCIALSGCTVNRVSLLTRPSAETAVQESAVKFYPTFKEINEPWRIEGMISAYTLPIAGNSPEKRKTLIREISADKGINAVIGLMPDIGSGVQRTGRSVALLANVGNNPRKNSDAMPKFIVGLPPVNFKIEQSASMTRLDDYLREYVQFLFSYMKGYYIYKQDLPGVNSATILQTGINSAILKEPLGITPDYVLFCDVEGYDEQGHVAISRSYTLKIKLTLFDVQENKPVWTNKTEGISTKSILGAVIMGLPAGVIGVSLSVAGEASKPDNDLHPARLAIMKALDSLPAVKGFQAGAISPIDRN